MRENVGCGDEEEAAHHEEREGEEDVEAGNGGAGAAPGRGEARCGWSEVVGEGAGKKPGEGAG